MQSWLLDNFELLIIVLSITALALAFVWWRTRQRRYAFGAGAALALMGLVWLLVYLLPLLFGESDSQQIERKVRAMAAAVKEANLDRIFSHISRDFNYRSHNKTAFRQKAEEVMRSRHVEEVIVWDFQRGEITRAERTARISFMVKARGNWQGSEIGYLCEAEFRLDSDGQWRMKGFELFNPFRESNQPIPIPGF
jgi:signal transduction histidine kinase